MGIAATLIGFVGTKSPKPFLATAETLDACDQIVHRMSAAGQRVIAVGRRQLNRLLHGKVDQLLNHQWQRLLEIQQLQMELMEEVAGQREREPPDE